VELSPEKVSPTFKEVSSPPQKNYFFQQEQIQFQEFPDVLKQWIILIIIESLAAIESLE
jgi:hypothetical protein